MTVDQSPRVANLAPMPKPAEVSNFETVTHGFEVARERLGLPDELAAVLRCA